jgi:hypothetical protein
MVRSTSLTMKNGEIAVVVGLVISVEPIALAFYDLQAHFEMRSSLFQRPTFKAP